MKKLLLCPILLSVHVTFAMDLAKNPEPQKDWRNNFDRLDKNSYNATVGYDLQLTLRPDDRENIVHEIPSLIAHGVGPETSPISIKEAARFIGPHRIPGDVITFYFPDGNDSFNPFFIFNSSFGQEKDIKSLLVALKAAYDCNLKGCNLFGQSRGAGTIVNALSVLNSYLSTWPKTFDSIKTLYPNGKVRKKIIKMVKNGVVVLDTPMITAQAGINAHVHKIFRGIFFEKFVCDLINYYVLSLVTRGNYTPSGPQALKSAENLPEKLKVLLSYQINDSSVGNSFDEIFAERLEEKSPMNVWVVLGSDGGKKICEQTWNELQKAADNGIIKRWWGITIPLSCKKLPAHNAGHITLLESGLLNLFYQQHGGSYKNEVTVSKKIDDTQILGIITPVKNVNWKAWMDSDANTNKLSEKDGSIKNKLNFGNICLIVGGWGTILLAGGVLIAYHKGYAPEQIYCFLKELFIDLISNRKMRIF